LSCNKETAIFLWINLLCTLLKSKAGLQIAIYSQGSSKDSSIARCFQYVSMACFGIIIPFNTKLFFTFNNIGVLLKFWRLEGSLHFGGAIICAMDISWLLVAAPWCSSINLPSVVGTTKGAVCTKYFSF
jgi:hypothetical protein